MLPGYLNWLSKTHDFVEACKAASEGTTNRVRLKEGRFLQIEVRLPPLAEQRRIVAKIEAAGGKIEEARGLRAASTQLLSRLVTSQHLKLSSNTPIALHDFLELHEERVVVAPGESYPQVGVKAFGQGLFPKGATAASDTTYKAFNRRLCWRSLAEPGQGLGRRSCSLQRDAVWLVCVARISDFSLHSRCCRSALPSPRVCYGMVLVSTEERDKGTRWQARTDPSRTIPGIENPHAVR